METQIPWNDGEGSILAEYGGNGSGPLRISSTVVNEGADRTQVIQVSSKDDALSVDVSVTQLGRRETFVTADFGNLELTDLNGESFLVLK